MQGLLIGSNLGSKTWRHLDKSSQGTNHPVINGQPALPPELQPVAASPLLLYIVLATRKVFIWHAKKAQKLRGEEGDSGIVRVTTWLTNRQGKVSFV